jgi:peptidoglycan/LPS O-acetylase OafA/YrhL
VDLFFVISGFIILFVHGRDIGQPARLSHYLSRRISRVLPLYWIALAATVAMGMAGGRGLPETVRLVQSTLLLPGDPVLGLAWTLQYEAVFYAVFALLILSRPAGLLVMAAWFGWIGLAALGTGDAGLSALHGDYALQFGLGMAAAALARRLPPGMARPLAGAGAVGFVVAMLLEAGERLDGYGIAARFAYGLPAAALILGLAGAERRQALAVPGWMRHLGGASYSLYLFQYVGMGVAWQAWRRLGLEAVAPSWLCFLVLAAAAILTGLAMARFVEKPLLRLLREGRAPRVAQPAATATAAVSAIASASSAAAPSTSPV